MGTLSWADAYGETGPMYQIASPISASGPNQSYVNPAFSGAQTGAGGMPGGKAPAFALMGLAFALLLLRVTIALGGDA